MSTYRQLKGYSIKSVASNPDNPQEGQVWYNSTELKLKARIKTQPESRPEKTSEIIDFWTLPDPAKPCFSICF